MCEPASRYAIVHNRISHFFATFAQNATPFSISVSRLGSFTFCALVITCFAFSRGERRQWNEQRCVETETIEVETMRNIGGGHSFETARIDRTARGIENMHLGNSWKSCTAFPQEGGDYIVRVG